MTVKKRPPGIAGAMREVQRMLAQILEGEPLRIRQRDDLVTGVARIEYLVEQRMGRLYLPDGYSVNMSGAIRLFTDIDPEVKRVEVFSGTLPEGVYKIVAGEWEYFKPDRPELEG